MVCLEKKTKRDKKDKNNNKSKAFVIASTMRLAIAAQDFLQGRLSSGMRFGKTPKIAFCKDQKLSIKYTDNELENQQLSSERFLFN